MNKSGLIEALSKDTDLPSGKAEEVVKVFFDEMGQSGSSWPLFYVCQEIRRIHRQEP
jgi:hypothetical protein